MDVGQIMTRQVVAVAPHTPLTQALRMMIDHGVSGLPVVDAQGIVVGMLTEGDMLRREETQTTGAAAGWLSHLFTPGREARDYVRTHGRRTDEIMTTPVIYVAETDSLNDAVRLMRKHRVKRLPVMRDGRLAGILSRADIVRQLAALLPSEAASPGDAAIRAALMAAIVEQPWAPKDIVRVEVKDGEVGLDGCLFDLDTRQALGVLAENIPGVGKVDNRIVCIEPYMGGVVFDPATGAAYGSAI